MSGRSKKMTVEAAKPTDDKRETAEPKAVPAAGGKPANGGKPPQQPQGGAPARKSAAGAGPDIFTHAPPEGHAKTVSAVLGEIVWLMSQSPLHKQFFISDLEWFVMTPILRQQFRLYYAKNKPVGVALWAFVDDEVAKRLSEGTPRLRPQDWKCGEQLWVVEVISPFGAPEAMIKNLKSQVFPDKELRYLSLTPGGEKEVKVL